VQEIISFTVKRLTSAAITLLLVSLMIFSAIHALPGSYADVFLGAYATPEAKTRIEEQFGLNRPLPVQYVKWLSSAALGDFGVSLVTQKPVAEEFAARLPVTAAIAVLATLLAVLIGLPAGLIGGLASSSRSGRNLSRFFGSLAISVPDFVIGTVLLFVVSRFVPWATVFSTTLLPAIALSALGIGFVMTATRHSTITASEGPWVFAAIARGMPRSGVLRHHILRNSAIPVVTVLGIYFGYLLGGTVIVEATFTVPGVGRYMLQAVALRDYPVVQAGALITATLFIALNLSVDLLYALLDPRIRTER
jgi:peptide/nickel transport system permease protein